MFGSAQPDTRFPAVKEAAPSVDSAIAESTPANGASVLAGQELDAALQLLVERAQYITGATGAALALKHADEMVCRASAGSSGPAVGARLQVRSGLSGESIARKQLLRCDNAETDPRVNLATCRELGIASIVVLPLLSRSGEVRGVFELFSDHAYAFEERDLIALERMADLTLTALDLAERKPRAVIPSVVIPEPVAKAAEYVETATSVLPAAPAPTDHSETAKHASLADETSTPAQDLPLGAAQVHSALFEDAVPQAPPAPVPEAMRRVQKCTCCGFPVSEGRSLCVDCENKPYSRLGSGEAAPPEFIPAFLDSAASAKESWIANHVNVLAVLVLVLSIVVAVVVFR